MPRSSVSLAAPAIALWASSLILPATFAEEYSWQVAGRYEDREAGAAADSSGSSVRATWYPAAVDDEAGPYELAPFLNRSSYVTVASTRLRHREQLFPALLPETFVSDGRRPDDRSFVGAIGVFPPDYVAFPSESGIDASQYAVNGRYVWPGSGWYAGGHARRGDSEMLPDPFFTQTDMGDEGAGLIAGRYFGPRTTLELGLGTERMSQELRASPLPIDPFFGAIGSPDRIVTPGVTRIVSFSVQTGFETETENARLSVRHVGHLGDSTFSLSASIRSSRSDTRISLPAPRDIFSPDDLFGIPDPVNIALGPQFETLEFTESYSERMYRLSGVLYPTQSLGVRLTFSNLNHDNAGSSDLVGLSANWFFVRNAAVEVELTRTSSGNRYVVGLRDTDAVAVRLLGRF